MPTGLRAEARVWQGSGWRAVESQYKNATIGLVHGRVDDQLLLEHIIEEVKPVLPPEAEGLHFLLSTPFRYQPPQPSGSRFRGRLDPAVFYGAEDIKTACAEVGYWRFRFWLDSAALGTKGASFQMTVFEFHGASRATLDLTKPPFVADRDRWINATDYGDTQTFAAQARKEDVDVIRFESVRNAPDGRCLAILTPNVFKAVREPYRHQQHAWHLYIQPPGLAVWQRALDGDGFEFSYA